MSETTGTTDPTSGSTTPTTPGSPADQSKTSTKPVDRQKELDQLRADQQKAAGKDPDEAPQPLAGSGNEGLLPPTEINGEEFDLPLDTSVALRSLAGRTISTDSQGVDRVVSNHVPDWEPAPIEPDPAEVARLETTLAALEAHREERAALLGLRADVSAEQGEKVSANG